MEVIRRLGEMQGWADSQRAAGRRIGLVPTMGYLHEGHVSLVRIAPTQFNPGEDYEDYPRDERGDLSILRAAGTVAVFIPGVGDMYTEGYQTFVEVEEVSRGLCGAVRPGHFRGVATVVAKLLNIGKPHVAVFGEKDYQQLTVIRRLVRDLDFDVEIVAAPIVREADGLAMSSRNKYLQGEDRKAARCLSRGLFMARNFFLEGERDPKRIVAAAPLVAPSDVMTILLAARVGPARLIDNITLEGGEAA
jgi:pantoate--beta-alanine ligase